MVRDVCAGGITPCRGCVARGAASDTASPRFVSRPCPIVELKRSPRSLDGRFARAVHLRDGERSMRLLVSRRVRSGCSARPEQVPFRLVLRLSLRSATPVVLREVLITHAFTKRLGRGA